MGSENKEVLDFCRNVKYLRLTAHKTNAEMARIMGIDTKRLSQIEEGVLPKGLEADVIIRISRYFRLKPSRLFFDLTKSCPEEWHS